MRTDPTRRHELRVLWLVVKLVAAIDLGLAVSEIVIRPLNTQLIDPRAILRVLAFAALAFAGMTLVRRPRPRQNTRRVAPSSKSPSTSSSDAEVLAASLQSIRSSVAREESEAMPLAVHLGARIVEVFWDRSPPRPVPPWELTPSGWVWEAARAHLDERPSGPDIGLFPALATIGATPTGVLWLNLEAFPVVSLLGEPAGVERLARHLLSQLRTSAAAGTLDLQLCSTIGEAGAAPLDPIRTRTAAPTRGAPSSVLARRARRPERAGIRPRVVAIAPGLPPLASLEVIDQTRLDAGVTCIVIGPAPDADLELTCHGGEVRVPFLGDVPVKLSGTDWSASDRATPTTPQPRNGPPASAHHRGDGPSIPVPTARGPDKPAAGVEVRVLGPVEVLGSPERLVGKSLEFVAYLAVHPDGVHEDQIRAALWPDRPLSRNSWATRVSITRRALGRGSDGRPRLTRFRDHVGGLSSDVRVDLDTLVEAMAHPDDAGGLRAALTMVRGRPFDDTRGFEWAHRESRVVAAERVIVDAAHQLNTLALAAGDWSQARWASEVSRPAQTTRCCTKTDSERSPPRPTTESRSHRSSTPWTTSERLLDQTPSTVTPSHSTSSSTAADPPTPPSQRRSAR